MENARLSVSCPYQARHLSFSTGLGKILDEFLSIFAGAHVDGGIGDFGELIFQNLAYLLRSFASSGCVLGDDG